MNKLEAQAPASPAVTNYQWVIFAILATTHMLMAMFFYSWGPLAPLLKEKLLINNSQFGLIVSIMYLAMVFVSIPSGFLTDKYGARWMLVISGSLMGIAFFLLSLFQAYGFLFVISALAGAGYGMINQITTKGLMYWFEPSKRATIMGIKQTGVTIGGSLIGIYIPFFSKAIGWERAVLLLALAIFAILLFSIFFYKEKPDCVNNFSAHPAPYTRKVSVRSVLLQPVLIALTLIFTLFALCQACLTSFLVVYTQETFHLSMVIAGSFLTVAMIGGTVSRVVFGLISDRIFRGDRIAPLALLALIGALSTFSLIFLRTSEPLWILFVISAFLGIALIGWNSLAIVLLAETAGNDYIGSVLGVIFTIAWGGMVIGPPVFGYVVDLKGYGFGWLILAILTGISFCGFATIWRKQRKTVNI